MDYKYIKLIERKKYLELVFNRPESLNALSIAMLKEIASALAKISQADQHVVVLKGEGRSFCVGADIKERKQGMSFESYLMERVITLQEIALLLRNSDKLLIAALKGHVFGGGMLLSLHADFRIAATGTVFRLPELEVGSTLLLGGYKMMIEAFGLAKAKELLFMGEDLSIEEAERYNIINKIVPPEMLEETLGKYIDKLSSMSHDLIKLFKKSLMQALDSRFDEVLSHEVVNAAIVQYSKK